MQILRILLRVLFSLLFVTAGIMHFARPRGFVKIVPGFLPFPEALVAISGVFEILGGLGLWVPAVSTYAAWGLVALLVAVFPANIYMAVQGIPFGNLKSPLLLWARLPLQFVLIYWAWCYT